MELRLALPLFDRDGNRLTVAHLPLYDDGPFPLLVRAKPPDSRLECREVIAIRVLRIERWVDVDSIFVAVRCLDRDEVGAPAIA